VFSMQDPFQAVEWAKLGVYESIQALDTARQLVVDTTEALRGPPDESGGYRAIEHSVSEAQALWRAAVWRYWLWCAAARAFHVRIPANMLNDARILAIEDRVSTLDSKVQSLDSKLDEVLALLRTNAGGASSSTSPRIPHTSHTRPPAPLFNGSKEGTKISTWFEQFASYATILRLTPDSLVDHASLCLQGKAAEQWALIRKSLALHGKDVSDFEVFKAELTACFVDLALEGTVRHRLAQLKQTGSVSHYYSQFRAIAVEAVTYPVSGPEACAAFRAGLKSTILEVVMKDASARQEMTDLEVVVKAAQEAESLLAVLAGITARDKARAKPEGLEEGELPPPQRPRDRQRQSKDKGKRPAPTDTYQAGLSKLQRSFGSGGGPVTCHDCGNQGHYSWQCPMRKKKAADQAAANRRVHPKPGQGTSKD
jgi:hypothetical protein